MISGGGWPAKGHRLGRRVLREVATIVTPDTILRWHRQLIARKWTHERRRVGRPGILKEIEQLTVRMAKENSRWGYTRIQGALRNLGHQVARSTIANILKGHGIEPAPDRPSSWRTFLAAHWGTIAAADFFTTDVWTRRGFVTYYSLFVIDLASRRVHFAGPTRHPDDAFMLQVARDLTAPMDGFVQGHRVLICDRDSTWSDGFRQMFEEVGVRVVQTPYRAPNCNAHAERFVRSIKEECLHRVIPLGERHLRHTIDEFVIHYHLERNHQGMGNELIDGAPSMQTGDVGCRQRLGGLLRYYHRAA
jgi:putative transposase